MNALVLMLLCGLLSGPALAGAGSSHGTADVLDDGQWELGLYAALRRGMGNDLELSVHPLTAALSPHLAVKKVWRPDGSWRLASRHSLIYPTHLLRFWPGRVPGASLSPMPKSRTFWPLTTG